MLRFLYDVVLENSQEAIEAKEAAIDFDRWSIGSNSEEQSIDESFMVWFLEVDKKDHSYERYCRIANAAYYHGYEINKYSKEAFEAIAEPKEAAKAFEQWYEKRDKREVPFPFKNSLSKFFEHWFVHIYTGNKSDKNQSEVTDIIQKMDKYKNQNI